MIPLLPEIARNDALQRWSAAERQRRAALRKLRKAREDVAGVLEFLEAA